MRRRSARRPVKYAPIPLGGRPRGSPWRRRGLMLVSTLVVLSAAAAVVAGATDLASGQRPGAVRAPVSRPPAVPAAASAGVARPRGGAARRRSAAAGVAQRLAVERLLRMTPVVSGGVPRRAVIALSFDDGPGPYTPKIVQALIRLHVSATFFVVGQQLQYFSAGLRDELRHGFEIGDHTQNHPWLIRLGAAQQYIQISALAAQVERAGAPAPTLFRPPYGVYYGATLADLRKLRRLAVLW